MPTTPPRPPRDDTPPRAGRAVAWLIRGLIALVIVFFVLKLVRGIVGDVVEAQVEGGRPAAVVDTPTPVADVVSTPAPAAPAPLPPLETPLASVAVALQRRADAGDAGAACRLGVELLRCAELDFRARYGGAARAAESAALDLEDAGRGDEAETAVQLADATRALEAGCAALPPALRERGIELLRQAALAGDPEAMLRYADGRDLFGLGDMRFLRSPHFDRWRQDAPAMLQRALAAGRPEAAALLAAAYGGGEGLVQSLVADDPLLALAYRRLSYRLLGAGAELRIGEGTELRPPTPTRAQRIEAERLAAAWHQEYFAGATFDAATLLDPSLVPYPGSALAHAGNGGSACGIAR